jgi:hypothetical protein
VGEGIRGTAASVLRPVADQLQRDSLAGDLGQRGRGFGAGKIYSEFKISHDVLLFVALVGCVAEMDYPHGWIKRNMIVFIRA